MMDSSSSWYRSQIFRLSSRVTCRERRGRQEVHACNATVKPLIGLLGWMHFRFRTSLLMKSRIVSSMSSWPNGRNNSATCDATQTGTKRGEARDGATKGEARLRCAPSAFDPKPPRTCEEEFFPGDLLLRALAVAARRVLVRVLGFVLVGLVGGPLHFRDDVSPQALPRQRRRGGDWETVRQGPRKRGRQCLLGT